MRGAAVGGLLHLRIDANPVPASRPRLSRWGSGVFYTANYSKFYAEAQKQLGQVKGEVHDGPMAVALRFLLLKPRTSKLWTPRADIDNLSKGPLDAITKTENVWRDDSQITDLLVTKRWALPDEPVGVDIYYAFL